jgi:hypothetical protein
MTANVYHKERLSDDLLLGRAHVPLAPLLQESWVDGRAGVFALVPSPADPSQHERVQVGTLHLVMSLEEAGPAEPGAAATSAAEAAAAAPPVPETAAAAVAAAAAQLAESSVGSGRGGAPSQPPSPPREAQEAAVDQPASAAALPMMTQPAPAGPAAAPAFAAGGGLAGSAELEAAWEVELWKREQQAAWLRELREREEKRMVGVGGGGRLAVGEMNVGG